MFLILLTIYFFSYWGKKIECEKSKSQKEENSQDMNYVSYTCKSWEEAFRQAANPLPGYIW